MEFYQLEQFSTIAKSRTMREAAARLHLSQPTLSQNLKKLESELGCKLFDRSHNRMDLTNAGRILIERCDHMVSDWHETLAEIEAEKQRQAQAVRVGCYSAVHCFFNMPQLAISFPHLTFEVWVREVAEIVDGYEAGDYDSGALKWVDEDKVPEDAERLTPGSHVWYLNLPKRWVAGQLYDELADEVIIGATVTIRGEDGSVETTQTDEFGDFWFRQISGQRYQVWFEAEGYVNRQDEADATEKDVNMGSIPIYTMSFGKPEAQTTAA